MLFVMKCPGPKRGGGFSIKQFACILLNFSGIYQTHHLLKIRINNINKSSRYLAVEQHAATMSH